MEQTSSIITVGREASTASRLHEYDDPDNWIKGDFAAPPLSAEQIGEFQKRLDSVFGAEKAIVLVWSGDRSYGDEFYTDWHFNGLPKGRPERKPVLLFGEVPVNETDYCYITCPRWLLMEVNHGSQLEAGWEDSAWVTDPDMFGGKKRIRTAKPPKYFYAHLRVIAEHEQTTVIGEVPPCCRRLWQKKRICYGKYRLPDDTDIAFVRNIRTNMDARGITQRNDEARSAKIITDGNLATQHFIKRAEQQRATAVKEFMLASPDAFFGDIVQRKGGSMSARELDSTVRQALEQQEEERFK